MSPAWYDQLYKRPSGRRVSPKPDPARIREFRFLAVCDLRDGHDLDKCREPVKASLALYIGGMGARNKNFYNSYVRNFGYEDLATQLQDLYLSGKKNEAQAAVPNELVDAVALVGPREHMRDQLARWKTSAGHHDADRDQPARGVARRRGALRLGGGFNTTRCAAVTA